LTRENFYRGVVLNNGLESGKDAAYEGREIWIEWGSSQNLNWLSSRLTSWPNSENTLTPQSVTWWHSDQYRANLPKKMAVV